MMQRRLSVATVFLVVSGLATAAHAQAPSDETPIAPFTPVTAERLLNAEDEPHNWLMYSGNYKSQRYSGLDQIDRGNAAKLEIQWVHQLSVLDRAETDAAGGRWRDVYHRVAQHRHRGRRGDRPPLLAIRARAP